MQVQIQTLIAGGAGAREGGAMEGSNIGSNIEVAKPPVLMEKQEEWEDLSQHVGYI